MMRVDVHYPSAETESAVLNRYGTIAATADAPEEAATTAALTHGEIEAARAAADQVHVSPEVVGYVIAISKASREDPHIALGLSTRGAIALLRAARIVAGVRDSSFVTPDDVKMVAPWVIPHRLGLSPDAVLERRSDHTLVQGLLDRTAVPRG
jgi:MoxR-like ATPase